MKTSIRSVRGTVTVSTRTVNQRFDPTEVETITLELYTGLVFSVVHMFDAAVYSIDGNKVTKGVFDDALHATGHDWRMWTKALDKKRQREDRQSQRDRHNYGYMAYGCWE